MAREDAVNEARFTEIIANDPVIRQAVSQGGRGVVGGQHVGRGGGPQITATINARLAELGIDPNEYHVDFNSGSPRVLKKSWLDKHGETATKIAAVGTMGALALPLLPGAGAAAAAPGATTAATVAPAATTGATVGTTAATAATVAPAAGGIMSTLNRAQPYIDAGGRVMGAMSQSRANNRLAEADYNRQQDNAEAVRQRSLNDQIRLDLDQREYADRSNQQQVRNALFGDFAAGVNDVSIQSPDGVPRSNITGGMRPSAMANRGTVGRELYQRSIANVLDPLEPAGMTDASGVAPNATPGRRRLPAIPYLPPLREVPQAGGTDRAMDLISIGSAGLGYLDDVWSNRRAPQPTPTKLPNNPAPWTPRLRPGDVSFR
jgi:hypothetical protein